MLVNTLQSQTTSSTPVIEQIGLIIHRSREYTPWEAMNELVGKHFKSLGLYLKV